MALTRTIEVMVEMKDRYRRFHRDLLSLKICHSARVWTPRLTDTISRMSDLSTIWELFLIWWCVLLDTLMERLLKPHSR